MFFQIPQCCSLHFFEHIDLMMTACMGLNRFFTIYQEKISISKCSMDEFRAHIDSPNTGLDFRG